METGNQALIYEHHLLKQAKLENCILSIRFFSDGLSVSIHQDKQWWFFWENKMKPEEVYEDLLTHLLSHYSFLQLPFKQVKVSTNTGFNTWIPSQIFQVDHLSSLCKEVIPFEPKHQELHQDFHHQWDAYQVFSFPKSLSQFLSVNFSKDFSLNFECFELFEESKKILSIQKKVFFVYDGDFLHLWALQGNKLLFQHTLEYQNPKELAFRSILLLEEFELDFYNDYFQIFGNLPDELDYILHQYIHTFVNKKREDVFDIS
ncbi:MAG: DUF3822 family protein [Flavobacteriales bacterium]|jgi:hypothetical protein|nr:DUF3822 family protein [Flavobacteriales bacterium]